MSSIVIVGGGFAGLWSAAGAIRTLGVLGIGANEISVTLINRDAYHVIRPRNYEHDLTDVRIDLDDVLGPIGVRRIEGEVAGIDPATGEVRVVSDGESFPISYDRLIIAAGSELFRPNIPGLIQHAFDVDTFEAAQRLTQHLIALAQRPVSPGRFSAVVVGAGLTGIEVACELVERMRTQAGPGCFEVGVTLIDSGTLIGAVMGGEAQPIIARALAELGIETRTRSRVESIDEEGVVLRNGERIRANTVVWSGGMRASKLASAIPVARDGLGRIPVDRYLFVKGTQNILAAGDVAVASVDGTHNSIMSCQHARPMGRVAGHNAVAQLVGSELVPFEMPYYVTCLDLGQWGALFTRGWDRLVAAQGSEAKAMKRMINCERIYPPKSGERNDILAAADPRPPAAPSREPSR